MATSVSVGPITEGKFEVTVAWVDKYNVPSEHKLIFSSGSLFFVNGPFGVKLKRPVCRHVDDVIRRVLTARS